MVDLAFSDERLAALYDRLYPRPPSSDFYLPMMLDSPSVLDVGCGTGEAFVPVIDGEDHTLSSVPD